MYYIYIVCILGVYFSTLNIKMKEDLNDVYEIVPLSYLAL